MLTPKLEERATVESPAQNPPPQPGPVLVRHIPSVRGSGTVRVQLRVLFAITALWACFAVGKVSLGLPKHALAAKQVAFTTHRVIEWRSVRNGVIADRPVALLQESWSDAGIDVVVEPVVRTGN